MRRDTHCSARASVHWMSAVTNGAESITRTADAYRWRAAFLFVFVFASIFLRAVRLWTNGTRCSSHFDPELLAKAKAIYTDDAALALPPGWQLVPVAQFHRSLLIELKQRNVALYQLERTRTL